MSKIIVTGYPYAYSYYFKVFEYLENKDDFVFILPRHWEAKNGKVKIDLVKKPGFKVIGLGALSYGGKSLYGGLFKGWMPAIAPILLYMRLKRGSRVLYSCSEPNLLTTLYNGLFAKLFGYKHVLFTWQNVPPEDRMSGLKLKISNALVKLNLYLSDGIICGNQKAAEIIKNFQLPVTNYKLLVSPLSGVDVDKFKPGVSTSKEKTVLFYGALEKRKGVDILIEAFSKITDINAKLVIIGTGPEKENLELLVSNYQLRNRIIFRDWMKNDELPEVLRSSAIFVYPSVPKGGWEEQFGYAMGEASASGIPVVATKTGSINEVVIDGQTGILVKPNDPDELKEALVKLLSNDELRRKMGQAGIEYINKNFSHRVICARLAEFLIS